MDNDHASLCGLGQTAGSAVLSAIKLWPELFEPGSLPVAHVELLAEKKIIAKAMKPRTEKKPVVKAKTAKKAITKKAVAKKVVKPAKAKAKKSTTKKSTARKSVKKR